MNRALFLKTAAPAALFSLALFGACAAAVWSINRLQGNLALILSDNVAAMAAAHDLEIQLRQLRFHSFVQVVETSEQRQDERRNVVEDDLAGFEEALKRARRSARTDEEKRLVADIDAGFDDYRRDLRHPGPRPRTPEELLAWADRHPVRELAARCRDLARINREAMNHTARESEEVTRRTRLAMLLLGLAGPTAGLLGGFVLARGLSQAVARLHVRLQDAHAHFEKDAVDVRLESGGGLHDLDRQIQRIVERVRTATEQLQRQQGEMLRAEQLAAVGRLAAGLAHEVRNPLTAIKLLVASALRPHGPPLTAEDLQVIHAEIVRLEGKVQHLLDFARPPQTCRTPCDLRDVVGRAVELVGPRARQQRVAVEAAVPDEPVVADADASQLSGVLVNLLFNALDAQPQGGRVELRLTAAEDAKLEVCDEGPGLSPAIADRLFTPFASTKPTGTGLGLSISRRVAEAHGGSLRGCNQPGGGACFTLTLPVRSPQSAVRGPEAQVVRKVPGAGIS